MGISTPAGMALSFIGGLLSSATPCVLAALPAACAVTSTAPVKKRLAAGISFTLGTTTALTALGTLSAYIGRSLSLGMRNLSILFGAALIVAGILMTGWVDLGLRANACRVARRSATAVSAFLFGLLFGTVITPCATPMLIAILGLLAAGSDPVRGAFFMLAYSLGHCALIFAAALSWGMAQTMIQRYSSGLGLARKAGGLLLCVAGALLIYSVL
ncbi:MAG: cytochrome c biogenesis CcdA family protein [Ignavibacteriales bacterium]